MRPEKKISLFTLMREIYRKFILKWRPTQAQFHPWLNTEKGNGNIYLQQKLFRSSLNNKYYQMFMNWTLILKGSSEKQKKLSESVISNFF